MRKPYEEPPSAVNGTLKFSDSFHLRTPSEKRRQRVPRYAPFINFVWKKENKKKVKVPDR